MRCMYVCVCCDCVFVGDLYVSVGKQQVHDDVLGEDLCVVDPEFDSGKLLGQLLSLVLLSGLPDVIQQGVLKGSAAGDRQM